MLTSLRRGCRRIYHVPAALLVPLLLVAGLSTQAQSDNTSPATVPRVGPSYLYPDPRVTPGVVNPAVTEANIQQTICARGWTATIRPPATYTNALKHRQLAAAHAADMNPAHAEEDHLISLELGGHPTDPRNLWPEPWGTPAHPLTARGPFPPHLVGAKSKDAVENALHREVCAGHLTLREAQQIIAGDWFKFYRDRLLH